MNWLAGFFGKLIQIIGPWLVNIFYGWVADAIKKYHEKKKLAEAERIIKEAHEKEKQAKTAQEQEDAFKNSIDRINGN